MHKKSELTTNRRASLNINKLIMKIPNIIIDDNHNNILIIKHNFEEKLD
jgi:hypothetical protein